MKASNDKLFLLISRLSASEKGYINKRLKASNPDSHVMRLFRAICKFKPMGENSLKRKIKDEYIISKFATVKYQLFERILQLLRDYNRNKGQQREVLDMLDDIDVLFEKNMHLECEKIICKAMNICDDNEWYGLKLHLLQWKNKISAMHNPSYPSQAKKMQQLQLDSKELIEKYKFSWQEQMTN